MAVVRTAAALGIGGNLGEVERTFKRALAKLNRAKGLTVLRRSDWISNPAVGGPAGQPDYLNGALTVETTLGARELLGVCLEMEAAFGREREAGEAAGPRTLDLDLLLFGDAVLEEPGLTVPHPRMLERNFVLEPLAQIAPDWTVPGAGMTVAQALEKLRGVSSP